MSVKEIELAVSRLPEQEVWEFAKWFEEFQAALWDKEMEQDIAAGRLDTLAEQALVDLDEGRTTEL